MYVHRHSACKKHCKLVSLKPLDYGSDRMYMKYIVFPSIPYLFELMTQKNSQNEKGMRVKVTHIFLFQ